MAVQIQLRGGTAAAATAANPILAEREMAVEIDTGKFKIGDGITHWNALAYGGIVGPTGATGAAGTNGAHSWTAVEVDFTAKPQWSKTFTIADAAAAPTSRVAVVASAKTATGRVGTDDLEWDGLVFAAVANTGTFDVAVTAVPGPVEGRRVILYQIDN